MGRERDGDYERRQTEKQRVRGGKRKSMAEATGKKEHMENMSEKESIGNL